MNIIITGWNISQRQGWTVIFRKKSKQQAKYNSETSSPLITVNNT